ncbi:MAG: hypothetical protein SGPRY_005464, partial [Prymnesium sp.]
MTTNLRGVAGNRLLALNLPFVGLVNVEFHPVASINSEARLKRHHLIRPSALGEAKWATSIYRAEGGGGAPQPIMSALETPGAKESGGSRRPPETPPGKRPQGTEEHMSLIEPNHSLDDAEVAWLEEQLESTSLQRQGIIWVIRGFFGHIFACGAVRWTVTNTGEPNSSGMRELELEKEGEASSARTRSAHHRRVQDFLRDIDFDEARSGVFEARAFDGVQDAVSAYRHPTRPKEGEGGSGLYGDEPLEVALGVTIHNRVELESASVLVNSKLELSAKRLKAVEAAVQSTPTGREKKRAASNAAAGGEGADDSESSSQSAFGSSEDDEPRPKRKSSMKSSFKSQKRSRPTKSEGETDVEDRDGRPRRAEARVPEAASFAMPTEWEDAEDKGAYEGRAGRAIGRLKAVLRDQWPLESEPASADDLREAREEVMERLLLAKEAAGPAARRGAAGMARDLFDAGQVGATPAYGQATSEKEGGSGAAALSAELQPGAVSADVAERPWSQAGALSFEAGGDVGARVRAAPEGMRKDLARAVGSNARVDAASERALSRTSLPGAVKHMCVALVSAVQRALAQIPTRDDVGLQYLALEAARKLAAAAVTGRLSFRDFTREAKGILGQAAPTKGSLEEIRAAWRLMRGALMA